MESIKYTDDKAVDGSETNSADDIYFHDPEKVPWWSYVWVSVESLMSSHVF
jgi:hypothetical protein